MIKGKKFVAALCLACLITAPTSAAATTVQQKLDQATTQKNDLNNQLATQKQQTDAVQLKVNALTATRNTLDESIKKLTAESKKKQAQLDELNAKQKELTQQKEQILVQLSGIIRVNYEDGGATYLNVLLGSTSWSEFLDRVYQVQCIIQKYNDLLTDLNKVTQDIAKQQEEISKQNAELQTIIQDKETAKSSSAVVQKNLQDFLSTLTKQQKDTVTQLAKTQSQINIYQDQIEQQKADALAAQNNPIQNSGSGITSPIPIDGGGAAVVTLAMKYIGVPYVWGGTSPKGWDCSGFTQWVFGQFGVPLYRTAAMQYTEGLKVSKSSLRPGDLVFFSTYAAGASHVGIYIGNGQMVNAASSRRGTVVDNINDSYWSYRYLGARRVVTVK